MPHKDPDRRREYARTQARERRATEREQRIQDREAALADRPRWPAVDLAWAAGMFEGEGTVTITKGSRPGYSRCSVSLTSTDPQIIEFFQQRWPATRIGTRQPKPNHKVAQVWLLQGNRTIGFLEDVLPYLRTDAEREKFAIVLECQRLRWRQRTSNERIAELHQRIRTLNQRGVPAAT